MHRQFAPVSELIQPCVAGVTGKVDILIVDDNPKNLLAFEAVLADLGENIVCAPSGTEALRCLLEHDFALTLLDIQMPELDGFQTAEIMRTRERSRHMPIIFLTAFTKSDEQVSQGYSLGAVDFLFKPIVPHILRAKVMAFVELFRKTEEIKRQAQFLRDVEKRQHERHLAAAGQRWEADRLREEMIKERKLGETLARTLAERDLAELAMQASNRRLLLLSEVASRLQLGARPEEILHSLYGQLAAHLRLEVYCNYLVEDEGEGLRLTAHGGIPFERLDAIQSGDIEPLSALVASQRRSRVGECVQVSDDPALAFFASLGLRACACFPLVAQGRLLGTLAFGTRTRDAFEPDDVSLLQVICDQVAMALERARLIQELSRHNKALADDDRRKDEFLAMLAHELRNPLAPIVNAVGVLRLPEAPPDVIARACDAIDRQVRHLVRLVDDLLDVARITSGKIELRREATRLSAVIDHAVQTSISLIQKRNQRFTASLPADDVTLFADSTRLAQVVSNLLNNASRYSPPDSDIELTAVVEGSSVVITVRDQGIGIQLEMLAQIFDLFVQSDRRPDRSQGGLGLGLTLVRNLVEMHEGTVAARSQGLGHGSEFAVCLPVVSPDTVAPVTLPKTLEPALKQGLRVILIEDNADVREILHDYLVLRGHSVEVASDGRGGVEKVLEQRPQVALVDIGLPGIDGYQVASEIRARAPDLMIRLIALTGYGRPSDKKRALGAGFDMHLVKPVDPEELHQLLIRG